MSTSLQRLRQLREKRRQERQRLLDEQRGVLPCGLKDPEVRRMNAIINMNEFEARYPLGHPHRRFAYGDESYVRDEILYRMRQER